ncbi:MAG: class I SAM-dependent methyltransferase [bacterium]
MNEKELRSFTPSERRFPDCTNLPTLYIFKSLFIRIRRLLWGRFLDKNYRIVWTMTAVSDAYGQAANVRNYFERKTIRAILSDINKKHKIIRACEIGCGYGRIIMALKDVVEYVKGFEREPDLVEIARASLPDIAFECVESLTAIHDDKPYDFVMTCTVLQHLTDSYAQEVCSVMKKLAPEGYILIIEKTDSINVTANRDNEKQFISRARSVETYEKMVQPFRLVDIRDRIVEPTYSNSHPGKCMLFVSPAITDEL